MLMTHPLLDTWKPMINATPPYILDGDKAALEDPRRLWNSMDEEGFLESESFLTNDKKKKTEFFMNLTPQPFLGKILDASVYLLMLNPGFSSLDLYAEENSEAFRQAHLKQLNGTTPNVHLDPQFHWTGGFRYWTKKLHWQITELSKRYSLDKSSVLSLLANEIAVLDLIPYHSVSFGLTKKKIDQFESARLMNAFFRNYVIPRCKRGECVVIVTRSSRFWDPPKNIENLLIYDGQQARGAYLTESTEGGKAIMAQLEKVADKQ